MIKRGIFFVCFAFFFLMAFASASMTISDVNQIYNFGDRIYITVEMTPSAVSGNFEINLFCENKSINLYKVPAEPSFAPGEQQKVSTFITLLPKNLGNVSGNCFIESSMGSEKAQTRSFSITNKILITGKVDKFEYEPGETISITIDAVKANGQLFEGFAEISGATDFSKAVSKGQLIEKFSLPETSAAGTYSLQVYIYDKRETEIMNFESTNLSFKIKQVPKFIQTGIDKTEVTPGENLTLGADLLDQSGKKMDAAIIVKIISPNNEESEMSLKSGEFRDIQFPFNSSSGKWRVFLSSLGITDEKEFSVLELQKISLEFLNGTSVLLIKNIGNSVYNQEINVTIGNETRKLSLLGIEIGEERKFNLNAPDGEYSVKVSDGDSALQGSLLLTGNAVSVNDYKGIGLLSRYPIVWVFLALIVASLAVVLGIRYFRKKTFKHNSLLDSKKLFPSVEKFKQEKKDFVSITNKVDEAESSMVAKGQRANSSIIVARFDNLTDNSKSEINSLLSKAKIRKGVIEWKDNYLIIIFSPLMTKSGTNEWTAAKVGYELYRGILENNKKHADKLNFGIGVHSGDLICAVENGKFKYTSVGGAVVLAKKIADFNSNKILISEDARRKIMKDLRVQKSDSVSNKGTYEITGVTDREANQGKLDDLLKRLGR